MNRVLIISFILVMSFVNYSKANRVVSGSISIKHVALYDYEITLIRYLQDPIFYPPQSFLNVFPRDTSTNSLIASIQLPLVSNSILPPQVIGCGISTLAVEKVVYTDTVFLDPSIYNYQGGYLFRWSGCCRGITENVLNSAFHGYSIVTLFPAVVDANGNPQINNTPDLISNISDYACNQHPFFLDYGGTDEDGDSLEFVLYTPFKDGTPLNGIYNGWSLPYPDPSTKFPKVTWQPGYSIDNQIHGFPGPNPSPNRLKIDSVSGEVSMTPDELNGYYMFGVWCREYRNGILIGSVFRDFELTVSNNCNISTNSNPSILAPQLQNFTTLSGDTLIFNAANVCLGISVVDPDPISDLEMSFETSYLDIGEYNFSQSSGVSTNLPFLTDLCFMPEKFQDTAFFGNIIVRNDECFQPRYDTLSRWFKFIDYSNAGIGDTFEIGIDTMALYYRLINFLSGNPNTSGNWYLNDNSNWTPYTDTIFTQAISGPISIEFYYIDQQANYPADTSSLVLNFVEATSISEYRKSKVSVFPNPTKGEISISNSADLHGREMTILDLTGKIIRRFILNADLETYTIFNIKDGIYIYKIEGFDKIGKIVISGN